MNIIFRADSSIQIGTGHVMRCLTLADELKKQGAATKFICRAHPGHMEEKIIANGHSITMLPLHKNEIAQDTRLGATCEQDASETIQAIDGVADYLIIDHYDIDCRWHMKLRSKTKKIMVIDDLANRELECDVILNQNIGCKASDYKDLIPSKCDIMVGTVFALLRPEFNQSRVKLMDKRLDNNKPGRIIVFMGGTDPKNMTEKVVSSILLSNKMSGIILDVVISKSSSLFNKLKKQDIYNDVSIKVHHNVNNMAELMSKADIAIGSGGSACWERCCLGLPSVLIYTADNQRSNQKALMIMNAAIDLGCGNHVSSDAIVNALENILTVPEKMREMVIKALRICDGLGVYRVVQRLLPLRLSNDETVVLRSVETQDVKSLYKWQNCKTIRRYSRNPKSPTWQEHETWFAKKIDDPRCVFNMIECNDKPTGIVRLDMISENKFEVSVHIAPEYQGKGLASAGLKLMHAMFSHVSMVAEVHPENIASQRLFKNQGYEQIDERTYQRKAA